MNQRLREITEPFVKVCALVHRIHKVVKTDLISLKTDILSIMEVELMLTSLFHFQASLDLIEAIPLGVNRKLKTGNTLLLLCLRVSP